MGVSYLLGEQRIFRLCTAPQPFLFLTHVLRDSVNMFRIQIYDFNAEAICLIIYHDFGKTSPLRVL